MEEIKEPENQKTKSFLKEYRKNYYEKNRKVLLEKATEKLKCEHCGDMIQKQHMPKHHKIKRCSLARMKKLKVEEMNEKTNELLMKLFEDLFTQTIHKQPIKELV